MLTFKGRPRLKATSKNRRKEEKSLLNGVHTHTHKWPPPFSGNASTFLSFCCCCGCNQLVCLCTYQLPSNKQTKADPRFSGKERGKRRSRGSFASANQPHYRHHYHHIHLPIYQMATAVIIRNVNNISGPL